MAEFLDGISYCTRFPLRHLGLCRDDFRPYGRTSSSRKNGEDRRPVQTAGVHFLNVGKLRRGLKGGGFRPRWGGGEMENRGFMGEGACGGGRRDRAVVAPGL